MITNNFLLIKKLFSPETRRLIVQTIKTHLENEECLEAIREAIVRKEQQIDWEALFDQFDLNKDGFISDDEVFIIFIIIKICYIF